MQNIGPGPLSGALKGVQREAKRGLITTVGYKLGDRPACYALEGSIKIAGAALTWLRDNLQLIENYEECDKLVNMTTNSAGVFFVPALGGLYSPYWDPNAAGIYIGLSQFSRREHLVRATFDSIAFQTNDILSLMRGVTSGLMIDGGLCKSDNLCQILADITGCDIVRPSMCETSALGAAMVAGCGAGIWSYESMSAKSKLPSDFFGFASAEFSNIHHHHPHESLNYEGKFSSLIQIKSHELSKHQQLQKRAYDFDNDSSESDLISDLKSERINSAIGVNDDAGGGGLFNYDAGGGLAVAPSSIADEEFEEDIGSSAGTTGTNSEDLLVNDCEDILNTRPHSVYATTSSGYSSGDNFEQNSVITNNNQRQDSPYQMDTTENEKRNIQETQITNNSAKSASQEAQTKLDIGMSLSPSRSSLTLLHESDDEQNQADDVSGPTRSESPKQVDVFQSYISLEHRTDLVTTWHQAVERSMNWTKIHHEEVKRIDYMRLSSLPISAYVFFSMGMIALSGILSLGRQSTIGG